MLWTLLACSHGPSPVPESVPAVVKAPVPPDATPAPAPMLIRYRNDTDKPITLVTSFGPLAPFAIRALDGSLPLFSAFEHSPPQPEGWQGCTCSCEHAPCPECEPPLHTTAVVKPGEAYEASWHHLLRHWDPVARCTPRMTAPAGTYHVSICDTDAQCAGAEVTLPTAGPLEILASSTRTHAGCADLDPKAVDHAARQFRDQIPPMAPHVDPNSCPLSPACVEPDGLEAALAKTRSEPCSLVVVPRPDRFDLVVVMPQPPGVRGGERHTQTYDPHGGHLLGALYEQ